MESSLERQVNLIPSGQIECKKEIVTMVPVPPSEDTFEEMTVEVDVNTMKGSPLDQDSVPSNCEDSQQSLDHLKKETAMTEERSFSITNADSVHTSNSPTSCPVSANNCKVGKTVFVCEVCSKTFEKRSRLLSHMLSHSNEKDHVCDICKKGFKNKSQLVRHSNTHSDVPRFCCNICGRGFKHNDVAKHIKRFHNGPRKSARGGVANPNTHAQYSSNQVTVEKSQQQCHPPRLHHENHGSLVKVAGEHPLKVRFLIEQQLSIQQPQIPLEIVTHAHPLETEIAQTNGNLHRGHSPPNQFPCLKCSKSFSKRSGLVSHMVVHDNVLRDSDMSKHQCHICLKRFTRSSGLNTHLQLHMRTEKRRDPNPDFRCHICGKMFTRRTGLNAHVLQHGGVLRFWCDEPECGKGFVHSYQMTRHKRSHSDIMPYTCNICGKSFRNNDLSKHMRTHTGIKPYSCQHCGKAFASSSSSRAHERMHLTVRVHVCEICNKGFPTSAGLRRHLKCHTDVKEKVCFRGKEYSKLELDPSIQDAHHIDQQQINPLQQVHAQTQQEVQQQLHVEHQVQHQLQQVQVQQVQVQHHLQHVQVSQLSQVHEVQVEVLPSVPQHAHPIALHVAAHDTDPVHMPPHQEQETTLATLTAHTPQQLPVSAGTEQATISTPANINTLPVLVPFSVSVPISVPFGINLNGSSSDQIHLNHFLSWEQKY